MSNDDKAPTLKELRDDYLRGVAKTITTGENRAIVGILDYLECRDAVPDCEDCRAYVDGACTHDHVSEFDANIARKEGQECGPSGELFEARDSQQGDAVPDCDTVRVNLGGKGSQMSGELNPDAVELLLHIDSQQQYRDLVPDDDTAQEGDEICGLGDGVWRVADKSCWGDVVSLYGHYRRPLAAPAPTFAGYDAATAAANEKWGEWLTTVLEPPAAPTAEQCTETLMRVAHSHKEADAKIRADERRKVLDEVIAECAKAALGCRDQGLDGGRVALDNFAVWAASQQPAAPEGES